MLPDVQKMAKSVMGVLDDETLQALLDTLSTIAASADKVPADLPPRHPAVPPPASAVPKAAK